MRKMKYSSAEMVKHLGKGVYGSVDLVKYTKRDGSSFHAAVKTSRGDKYDSLYRELQVLTQLSGSSNIVQCFTHHELERDFNSKRERVYKLLLEHASEGSLRAFMYKYADRVLPEPLIRAFTRMILQGLVSIHDNEFVHCDLKSDNLLVFPRGEFYEVKVADFGNTLQVGDIPEHWVIDYPFVGTASYMPPESFRTGRAEKALDIWSLGCLVLEMYTGERPWSGLSAKYVELLILHGKVPDIPESVPCDAREFIETCFARNPKDRGTASELLFHRFLPQEEEKSVDPEDYLRVLFDDNAPLIGESVHCDAREIIETSEDRGGACDLLCQEEEQKEETIIAVSVAEETRNSWLSKMKLRFKRASKKSMDPPETPLKSKMLSHKSPPLKKFMNKLLRLKTFL